jgi:DNA-directed RNA polymerase sigma subunit (sigma70/sigma32)
VATLEAIALELGVSKERVRQIQNRALQKCRAWCRLHGYEPRDLNPGA